MLKIIIADDDPNMRLVLKKVLEDIPGIKISGEAENGKQLIKMVEELNPDIIFVDVDMPEMNGVEAAKEIFDINPQIIIIFATAFDNYAHEAFQVYAFDYLIKPFNLSRIRQTMERIKELLEERGQASFSQRYLIQIGKENMKILIQSNGRQKIINIQDVILITRVNRETVVYTLQDTIKTYEPLRKFVDHLKDQKFFRCHKGYIINTDMVTEISPWGNKSYLVKMANTSETALMTFEKAKEFRDRYCV